MTVFIWWLVPIIATLTAVAWVSWQAARSERKADQGHSTAELARMKRALSRSIPAPPDPRS